MTAWYLAYCDECGEDVATADEDTRERWAAHHYQTTDEHVVRYWTATEPTLPGLGEISKEAAPWS